MTRDTRDTKEPQGITSAENSADSLDLQAIRRAARRKKDNLALAFEIPMLAPSEIILRLCDEAEALSQEIASLRAELERLEMILGLGGLQGDAPPEMLICGWDPAGCDAWQTIARWDPDDPPEDGTDPVRYVRADVAEERIHEAAQEGYGKGCDAGRREGLEAAAQVCEDLGSEFEFASEVAPVDKAHASRDCANAIRKRKPTPHSLRHEEPMTELRDIVPSRETCQILAEAGWQEETYFVWCLYQTGSYSGIPVTALQASGLRGVEEKLPAPTAAELGEALPPTVEDLEHDTIGWLNCTRRKDGRWEVFYKAFTFRHYESISATEAEARARLWLKLRESSAQRTEDRTCGAGVQE